MNEHFDQAYIDYQMVYQRRQNEVITRLLTLTGFTLNKTHKKWLLDAIDFINKEKQ